MWTWTKAHEFTHDDEGDQVMALFSLSHPKEKNKKKTHFTSFFSPTNGTFLSGVFSASVTFVYGDLSRVRGIQSKDIYINESLLNVGHFVLI